MNERHIPTAITPAELLALHNLAEGKVVLELGAYLGASTVVLADAAERVHSVDWHRGDEHSGHIDSLAGYFANTRGFENIVSHVGRFEDVLPALRQEYFDLAFLDGYHTTEATQLAVELATPLLMPGGVLVFHDYGVFGVAPVVDALGGEVVIDSLATATPEKGAAHAR